MSPALDIIRDYVHFVLASKTINMSALYIYISAPHYPPNLLDTIITGI